MTVMVDTSAVPVRLRTDCCDSKVARDLWAQFSSGAYNLCSVLEMPDTLDAWLGEHRTARKRRLRALRLGYTFRELAREHHADEIHAVNTSLDRRQGRPMSSGYLERQEFSPLNDHQCEHHQIRAWGVWTADDQLVAYTVIHRAGDLALVSQILGHGDHQDDGIMYLLFAGALEQEIPLGGLVVYNRHDSGQDGLRWFKERLGFEETPVWWIP
jgi:hypothetical protein